jgi:acetyl esterase/lipase
MTRSRRRVLALLLALGALAAVIAVALASRGGDERAAPVEAVERLHVGTGATAATIFRPAGSRARLPVVIFLHGWGAVDPAPYRPWLGHLARRGNVVIYPAYQTSALSPPSLVLGDALRGVEAALDRVDVDRHSLVVAGHSAGGALAADYAAISGAAGLPRPRAVFSVYPGRRLEGIEFGLPAVGDRAIPSRTRIVALAGARDRVVGDRVARALVRDSVRVPDARKRFIRVTDPAVSDHLGPLRDTAPARREFWARLDALMERARE